MNDKVNDIFGLTIHAHLHDFTWSHDNKEDPRGRPRIREWVAQHFDWICILELSSTTHGSAQLLSIWKTLWPELHNFNLVQR